MAYKAYKVAYLFGAGATHAEVMNSIDNPSQADKELYGLLISHVSDRVMKRANKSITWLKEHENVFASKKGSFNIELLISLFINNRAPDEVISSLKELVQQDIKGVLAIYQRKFYLHKALLELHEKTKDKEELVGVISLNYDTVLDKSFEANGIRPNYSLSTKNNTGIPLLKLHGSFDWTGGVSIDGRKKLVNIIPIGTNKNYLFPPYNFIWGKAYELLKSCDVLRIIGCSLNQNDFGLIDLLYKAHADKKASIKLKIIDFQPSDGFHSIKNNYGFFPDIIEPNPPQERTKLKDSEELLIADINISNSNYGNPFKIWLKAKAMKMLKDEKTIQQTTKYLKKCF
ncbi:MAG: hypothetical protein IT214_06835 [Chitinophagaceae bacterium]|nr:hypothetical protein [Chitinophagaceae bacterium]